MKSPLSLEERMHVGRVFGHDFNNELAVLGNIAITGHDGSRTEEARALLAHAGEVIEAFATLTRTNETYLAPTRKQELELMGDVLREVMPKKKGQLSMDISDIPSFSTARALLYVVMYNLVKNSFGNSPKAQVSIGIAAFSGMPPDVVFRPDNAQANGKFVRIAVHDTGAGFPAGQSLASYLEFGASSRKGGGFGLFFAKMAAKYLQASLAIHSEPDNTSVALYHPLGLD